MDGGLLLLFKNIQFQIDEYQKMQLGWVLDSSAVSFNF
jgi:hypothetical protein